MSRSLARCFLTLILVGAAPLQGCGQTGPLYLPSDDARSTVPAADETSPAEAVDDDEDNAPR